MTNGNAATRNFPEKCFRIITIKNELQDVVIWNKSILLNFIPPAYLSQRSTRPQETWLNWTTCVCKIHQNTRFSEFWETFSAATDRKKKRVVRFNEAINGSPRRSARAKPLSDAADAPTTIRHKKRKTHYKGSAIRVFGNLVSTLTNRITWRGKKKSHSREGAGEQPRLHLLSK